MREDAERLARPRWRGQAGRIETWYATFTDPRSGEGYWLHAETVAPRSTGEEPAGAPFGQGWFAVFPPEGPARVERFGPEPISGPRSGVDEPWFAAAGVELAPGRSTGKTATMAWDLTFDDVAPPLYPFPPWAWEREALPGAQIVPCPSALVTGRLELGDRTVELDRARGGLAHIYGHGHAKRWGWLHADLGGSDVLEIVSAVSTRPGMEHLPAMSFVRLRRDERDWPPAPLAAAPLLRGTLELPRWQVAGVVGRHRLRVDVTLPAEPSVALRYADPDGATATCTNSERADAEMVFERWSGRWQTVLARRLEASAHAELGTRP